MEVKKLEDVTLKVKIGRTKLLEMIDEGEFPMPFNVTKRICVWDVYDLDLWLEEQKKKKMDEMAIQKKESK